jgi:HPt (histidine-containing phosphotransfer) domain-containing protein
MEGMITDLGSEIDFGEVFDRIEALDRLNGDQDLLKEIASMFFGESQQLLANVDYAVRFRQSEELQRSAHRLRGAASNFSAHRAVEAAHTLEQMGTQQRFHGVSEAWISLETEIRNLRKALQAYLRWQPLQGAAQR